MAGVRAAGGGRKSADKNQISVIATSEILKKVEIPLGLRDETAINIWRTQADVLMSRQVLTMADLPLLISYCNSFSLYLEAEQEISDSGFSVCTADGGLKKHPAVNARQDALSTMMRSGSLLGLDPLSRAKLNGGSGKDGDGKNPFDEFS